MKEQSQCSAIISRPTKIPPSIRKALEDAKKPGARSITQEQAIKHIIRNRLLGRVVNLTGLSSEQIKQAINQPESVSMKVLKKLAKWSKTDIRDLMAINC